jgi:hypothetical protein
LRIPRYLGDIVCLYLCWFAAWRDRNSALSGNCAEHTKIQPNLLAQMYGTKTTLSYNEMYYTPLFLEGKQIRARLYIYIHLTTSILSERVCSLQTSVQFLCIFYLTSIHTYDPSSHEDLYTIPIPNNLVLSGEGKEHMPKLRESHHEKSVAN